MAEIISIYDVTDFVENQQYEEHIEDVGQDAINQLRSEYPKFTKFVLRGFQIDGVFKPLKLNTYNNWSKISR